MLPWLIKSKSPAIAVVCPASVTWNVPAPVFKLDIEYGALVKFVAFAPANLTWSPFVYPSTLPVTVIVPLPVVVTALAVWKLFAGVSIVNVVPTLFALIGNSF